MSDSTMKTWGVLAEFDSAQSIYYACEKVRDAGYSKWDAHTPFPVHGLDKAMGLKSSTLPWLVLCCGLTGVVAAMTLQWWVHAVRYPLVFAAKPMFSWQAFVPVTFEVMVLFSALGAVIGMFHFNRLPQLYHPLFRSERFERVTDDRFFISIEAEDPSFEESAVQAFLTNECGALHVEVVED
jgi:hypothetical protein